MMDYHVIAEPEEYRRHCARSISLTGVRLLRPVIEYLLILD
jgi:hypothetical protein